MTALKEFERLESPGIWRQSPDAQRRDVIVFVGDATLVIADQHETALSHWSLPAVERINPGERPAHFRPGPDASEMLELSDDTMIRAIAKVHTAIERRRPHPGRLRYLIVGGVSLIVLLLAVFWLPGAMIKHTVTVVPTATRLVIGHALLDNISRVSGRQCSTPDGNRALAKIHRRLLGENVGSLAILSGGVKISDHLPGGIVLLNRSLVEDYESPEVLAGYVLAENERSHQTDPLLRMLRTTGLASAFQLLTTGKIAEKYLDQYGELLLTDANEPVEDLAMLKRFKDAMVRSSPYAYAKDISGEATIGLIEADPISAETAVPVLKDGEWVGLQQICGE